MGLRAYPAVVNGTKTTLMLTDEDAKARGLTPSAAKQKTAPTNKAAKPAANKES